MKNPSKMALYIWPRVIPEVMPPPLRPRMPELLLPQQLTPPPNNPQTSVQPSSTSPETPSLPTITSITSGSLPSAIIPSRSDDFDERDPRSDWIALSEHRKSAAARARSSFGLASWTHNITQPEPPWLIENFLQERALHVISAAKGSLKTWLGLTMFLSGRYGFPVLGFQPTTFDSIYVAADSPLWDIRRQLRKLVAGHDLKLEKRPHSFIAPLGFKLDDPQHREALSDVVRAWNIRAIFLDVLLYTHGADENSDREMSQIMKYAKYLRDNLGLAVVALHHHAKTTGSARGADTILQACEHHYELRKKGSIVHLHREKVRGEEDWTEKLFSLTPANGSGRILQLVEPASPPISGPSDNLEGSILSALASGPQERTTLLTFASSPKAFDNAIQRLRREGKVTNAKKGVWQLCPSSS